MSDEQFSFIDPLFNFHSYLQDPQDKYTIFFLSRPFASLLIKVFYVGQVLFEITHKTFLHILFSFMLIF